MSDIRLFETGATRDSEEGKLDYEGFLSPLVLERYAQYMQKHRVQPDGALRASDNWQKGIPITAYMKSAWRHFHEWWKLHRIEVSDYDALTPIGEEDREEAVCALIFNAMGYLHEILKQKRR